MAVSERAVTAAIRKMIVSREIPGGERITETSVANLLDVSRTPARGALRSLEMEGLVERRDGRGYTVLEIDIGERPKALRVRGVLEGLAARIVAENGLGARAASRLQRSLEATAAIVAGGRPDERAVEAFEVANAVFHETIVQECDNDYVAFSLDKLKALPLMSEGAFAFRREASAPAMLRLAISHSQHAIIHRAIRDRDGARAEAMMREHANASVDYGEMFGA